MDSIESAKEKLWNGLKKYGLELKKHGVDVEISPALTLLGIVTVSAGKLKINPDPEKWDQEEETQIEEVIRETVKISFDEFREILKDEIRSKDEEEIESEIKKICEIYKEEIDTIVRSIKEYPLLRPEEFEDRSENQFLKRHKKFVGREEELKELHNFLINEDEKLKSIIGSGGIGKTRLALEFAKQVEAMNDWEAYFIHPHRDFRSVPIDKNTLLVLDEASIYKDKDKVIDYAVNPSSGDYYIKLLLLDRPIFEESIKSNLIKRDIVDVKPHKLEKGNIVEFLRENEGIGEHIATEIEKLCENSFVYAVFYAEYFQKTGKLDGLKQVLAMYIEKYLEDFKLGTELRTGTRSGNIKDAMCTISLITPIDWFKDKQYLEETLFSGRYELIGSILDIAELPISDFIFPSDDGFVIKPDPIADYLRTEFMKKEGSYTWIKRVIPYMPTRVSSNIASILGFDEEMDSYLYEVLSKIWIELNSNKGRTPEYFSAILMFTGNFNRLSFFDVNKMNIDIWIEAYEYIARPHLEKEIREPFAKCLVNATNVYGQAGEFEKMAGCLDVLRKLHEAHDDEKEVRELLAKGLFNATNVYGRADDGEKMAGCLDVLRKLHEAHDDEKEVRELLAKGLFNATNDYGRADEVEKMAGCLDVLRKLHEAHDDEKEVRELLANGLVNATNSYGRADEFEEMAGCLDVLRKLHEAHPEKEVREQFANGLVNATNYYRRADEFEEMARCLGELRQLHEAHPEKEVREQLANGLFNATNYYRRADDGEKMAGCLDELRKLHEAHPEKEVREPFASGLFNATNYYGRSGEVHFDDLILLYKLRFDLLDKHNKQKAIESIESMFINETSRIISSACCGDDVQLKTLINNIKEELMDDAGFVLLMASEKLPLNSQKSVLDMLNS